MRAVLPSVEKNHLCCHKPPARAIRSSIPRRLLIGPTALLFLHAGLLGQPAKNGASPSASGKNSAGGSANQNNSSGGGQGGGQGGGTAYFETQMLAYGAVNQLSEAIASEVCKLPASPTPTVILFDQGSFQNLQLWQSFQATVALLGDAYATLLTDQEVVALNQPLVTLESGHGPSWAGAQGFGALSGLVGAIAASTTNTPSTFTIQDSTMAVSIAHQVARCQPTPQIIYYPLFGNYVNASPKTLVTNELDKLNKVRKKVQDKVLSGSISSGSASVGNGIVISPGSASLLASQTQQFTATAVGGGAVAVTWSVSGPGSISASGIYTAPASAPSPQTATVRAVSTANAALNATATVTVGPAITTTDARFSILQDLNSQYDQLITSLLTSTGQAAAALTGTAPAGITSLVQGADLDKRLASDNTYVLYADVVAAGGTQIDRKNIFTVLFSGDWLSYSGGVVANVALTRSKDNHPIFSDTLRYRTAPILPFATLRHPRSNPRVESSNVGDNAASLRDSSLSQRAMISSIEIDQNVLVAGSSVTGTIRLNAPAPPGGLIVNLNSSGPVSVPTAVTVPAGQTDATFSIGALPVQAVHNAKIQASEGRVKKAVDLRVSPVTH
jgi:hypothetical protein